MAGAPPAVTSMDQRLMLGMAVSGGFLFVCACAGCIRAVSKLSEMRERRYTSLEKSQEVDRQVAEEQEREQILSEVYGRPEADAPEEEEDHDSPIKDDIELDRAWEAIRHAESSDEEEEGPVRGPSAEGFADGEERGRVGLGGAGDRSSGPLSGGDLLSS